MIENLTLAETLQIIKAISWLIIVIAISVIAIKITFSFDINKFLERRDKKLKQKAQNYCPHAQFIKVDGKFGIKSTFISPSGTTNWICQRCGTIRYNVDNEDERIKYYLEHPEELSRQEKKFEDILKKIGVV